MDAVPFMLSGAVLKAMPFSKKVMLPVGPLPFAFAVSVTASPNVAGFLEVDKITPTALPDDIFATNGLEICVVLAKYAPGVV